MNLADWVDRHGEEELEAELLEGGRARCPCGRRAPLECFARLEGAWRCDGCLTRAMRRSGKGRRRFFDELEGRG